ncbi:MAG TPA: amidohydrolase family protein [Herpetosiphonaceae bacterium]|nr:amidohydrolase family protein [Herpetosiphonaceae bacterium]
MQQTKLNGLTRYALQGRVVTMDPSFRVLKHGLVYVDQGGIVAVISRGAPPPPGMEDVPLIPTRGTIYPGLIELHNHLSYNALPLWNVPQKYTNRAQWQSSDNYRALINEPLRVLGHNPDQDYVRAIVRFAECRCLLGGVTTSQGMALFSNTGIGRYYHGVIRVLEEPDFPSLPAAASHISDVAATDAARFLVELGKPRCLLLHLSEGTDAAAHDHFAALHLPDGRWAITQHLAGIHCVALTPVDWETMQANGGSLVWSPLSNLLLYGQTADIKTAKASGIRIGIGADWAPTGSKNLLGELKVARLVSDHLGGIFSDRELVAMATCNGAAIAEWDQALGSIQAGKRADLLIVEGTRDDPYSHLLQATEAAISLVVVDGVPRYGRRRLMERFGVGTEHWKVNGAHRVLNLGQDVPDPAVGNMSLRAAYDKLVYGLEHLPDLAQEHPTPTAPRAMLPAMEPHWSLVLDHDEPDGMMQRPYLLAEPGRQPTAMPAGAEAPLTQQLVPQRLDPLTVVDDPTFLDRLRNEANVPDYLKEGLPQLY